MVLSLRVKIEVEWRNFLHVKICGPVANPLMFFLRILSMAVAAPFWGEFRFPVYFHVGTVFISKFLR